MTHVDVVAHRGASEDAPEHTLAAYTQAIADGADALEADVRLTRDGHLVCVHDRRIDRTSNGRGIVSTLELAELTELDWGRWKGQPAAYAQGAGTYPGLGDAEAPDRDRSSILTLERLCEVVASADRRVELAIETKHPTRYAGLVERRLLELIDRFGWAHPRLGESSPVRVMSFSQRSMRRMRLLAPSLDTVFLLDRVPLRFRDGSLPPGVRIAGPAIHILRAHPRYVARLHRRGAAVHVWTVDHPDDVTLCLELGVDAIITNRPRSVLEAVREARR
jgi:glycerophosphoryl diester phosphodiesterase